MQRNDTNVFRRQESSSDEGGISTTSTAPGSRRGSASDSGVGYSEYEEIQQAASILEKSSKQNTKNENSGIQTETPSNKSSAPMAGLPLAGAIFGLCLGGPVGLLAGAKLGGVAAIGGSILGYTGASVIKEQKEMRKFIDEHYKKEPDLYVRTPKEDAIASRNRNMERSPPDTQSNTPSLHRAGSITRKVKEGYSSANSSPVARRKNRTHRKKPSLLIPGNPPRKEKPTMRRPPNLQTRQFRKLGDLTEAEQRSIVALINKDDPVGRTKTLIVTAIVCDTHATAAVESVPGHSADTNTRSTEDLQTTQEQGKNVPRRKILRASSLPDVLEEDLITSI